MKERENAESLRQMLRECQSDKSKMAGAMSSISKSLASAGVKGGGSIQQRVKLLSLLYQEEMMKNKKLTLMLEIKEDDGRGNE